MAIPTIQPLIQPDRTYTFYDYFQLTPAAGRVADYFGYQYQRERLSLPGSLVALDRVSDLKRRIEENLKRVNLTNETARREFLIAPILSELIFYTDAKISVEEPLYVSRQLQDVLDYYLEAHNQLLVIEAKNADMQRGFTQLAVELIALDQALARDLTSTLYGSVSIGDIWQFATLQRTTK